MNYEQTNCRLDKILYDLDEVLPVREDSEASRTALAVLARR